MFVSPDALVSHSSCLVEVGFPDPTIACGYPKTLGALSQHLNLPQLKEHIRCFLYDQENPNSDVFGMDVELDACPHISSTLHVDIYHSAAALYHAPSDLSGIGGMHCEYICDTLLEA